VVHVVCRYLLFYQHAVQTIGEGAEGEAGRLATMWEGLTPEDRALYANMAAALDSQTGAPSLSPDLATLDLEPLNQPHDGTHSMDQAVDHMTNIRGLYTSLPEPGPTIKACRLTDREHGCSAFQFSYFVNKNDNFQFTK